MKTSIKTITATIFIAAFALCSTQAMAVSFTEEEKGRLQAGKTIKKPLANSGKKGFYGGSSYSLIDAPVDVVWNAIHDFGAYKKMFAATSSVKEVEKRGDKSLIHYKMGYKLINLEYYVELKKDYAKRTMSFSLVENRPHDISMAKGYWRLFPQKGGRTLVAYVISARVPMGVVNLMKSSWHPIIERNLVGAPASLKKWIASPSGKKYFTATARK